jgi:2-polyprenyl-3-methyl-5-hydroxy-6-metoxy-1,4-benzoquinol methylase
LTHPRETYDALAAGYVAELEASPFIALYEEPALRSLVPPVAGRAVVDAGCGAGRYSRWLTDEGGTVTGLDASPQMLLVTCARAR